MGIGPLREKEAEELRKLDWELDLLERLAARKARRGQTPPPPGRSVTEADQLAEEAAILRQAKLGRVTPLPAPEKETQCLRAEPRPVESAEESGTPLAEIEADPLVKFGAELVDRLQSKPPRGSRQ